MQNAQTSPTPQPTPQPAAPAAAPAASADAPAAAPAASAAAHPAPQPVPQPDASAAAPAAGRARRGLSAFPLKVLAIVGMTANHACYIFWPYLPPEALCVLFGFGGLTFPIMAFLLVEGYRHTSNLRRYATRLLVFALIAQVPYTLFLAHAPNVLFTLLVGLVLLHMHDRLRAPAFWLVFALVTAATALFDWGVLGPVMIIILKLVDDRRWRVAYSGLIPILGNGLPALGTLSAAPTLTNLGIALYPLVGCTATIPLLCAYNGQRGRPMKWFFYAYYPAHIAILGLAKGLLLGDWSLGY